MLFQIVHTHSLDKCPAQYPEQAKRLSTWWQSLKKTSGIKVLSGYVTPNDHTFYITVEADDYPTLARALGPLVGIGTGHISPALSLDQAAPMAEAGEFRASK